LLNLEEDDRILCREAQCEINPSAPDGILWPDLMRIPGVPSQFMENPQNYALRNSLFIGKTAFS